MLSTDYDEIRKVFEEVYAENVRTRNIEGYGNMYTEDALWMPRNALDRRGRKDIMKGFADSIAHQDIDPVLTADEIEVMGDFAYVIGISALTIRSHENDDSKQVKYRTLWLMKKESEEWKIDRQIWNEKPF